MYDNRLYHSGMGFLAFGCTPGAGVAVLHVHWCRGRVEHINKQIIVGRGMYIGNAERNSFEPG